MTTIARSSIDGAGVGGTAVSLRNAKIARHVAELIAVATGVA